MSKSNKKLERGLKSCVNLLVSIVSLILWGREFQAAGPALTEASFTKPRLNTKYDVVSSIVRPQTGSDWVYGRIPGLTAAAGSNTSYCLSTVVCCPGACLHAVNVHSFLNGHQSYIILYLSSQMQKYDTHYSLSDVMILECLNKTNIHC